jgi:XTP/dITP diphosphohydrolase
MDKFTLIFASNNVHKVAELKSILSNNFEVLSLKEVGLQGEIPEDFETLEENAMQKAEFIYSKTEQNCLSDDTGLEVDALNGAPGVYSARYAGEKASFDDNINKLLSALKSETKRTARFKTVIAVILNGQKHTFEGICEGYISTQRQGKEGFGYDPIFIPNGETRSFAEMTLEEKNAISHRGQAFRKAITFLNTLK